MTEAVDWLRDSPLTWVFLTLLAYRAGVWVRDRTGGHPLAQPVLVAAALLITLLAVLGIDYDTYMTGGALIHLVLGPATVALAAPLHRQAHHLREMALPLVVALPAGALVSIGSAVLTVRALGGSEGLEHTIAPKAATTPVAIAIADHIGECRRSSPPSRCSPACSVRSSGRGCWTGWACRTGEFVAWPWARPPTASAPRARCTTTSRRGPSRDSRWVSPPC